MRVKKWALSITWEDGETNDVSNYIPDYTHQAIEEFCNYWEERYGNDEETSSED